MNFTTIFPLEDAANCEPCGFHVLRILAKVGPYAETFPRHCTRILSPGITAGNTFSRMPELHFTSFNIGWSIFSRERVQLISFRFNNNLNYEWRSCNSGVCVGLLKYLDSVIHFHVFRLDRHEAVQSATSLPDLSPAAQFNFFQATSVTRFSYVLICTNRYERILFSSSFYTNDDVLCSLFYGVCIYVWLILEGKNENINWKSVVFSTRNRCGPQRTVL